MSEEEYLLRLKIIEDNYEQEKRKLYYEFGVSNAIFKEGDIIKNSSLILQVDKITVSKSFGLPTAVYHGFELKKDLTPRKDKNRVSIHGNNADKLWKNKTLK